MSTGIHTWLCGPQTYVCCAVRALSLPYLEAYRFFGALAPGVFPDLKQSSQSCPLALPSPPRAARAPQWRCRRRCAAADDGRAGAKLKVLDLERTQITDAGCATLTAALDSGALPALEGLFLIGTPASAAGKTAVCAARASLECYV